MLIEKLDSLNQLISEYDAVGQDCIICIQDNKSGLNVSNFIVKHPVELLRNLNEISKSCRLPVSDMDIIFVGFLFQNLQIFSLKEDEKVLLSPYIYFKKPEEVSVKAGSEDSTTPVKS